MVRRKETINSVFRESIITAPNTGVKKEKNQMKNWDSPLAMQDKEANDL